jgi:hypothetical protein
VSKIRRIASVGHAATARRLAVKLPAAVHKGDLLLLTVSSAGRPASLPAGWKPVGNYASGKLNSAVYDERASGRSAGSTVTAHFPERVAGALVVSAYRHVAANPIEVVGQLADSNRRSHPAPLVEASRGSWAVWTWTARATGRLTWRLPGPRVRRLTVSGLRKPRVSTVVADSGHPVHGVVDGGVANTSRKTGRAVAWVIVLRP